MAEFICYEILNCGEGNRGGKVEVMGCATAEQAAAQAAEYFDDVNNSDCGKDDLDGCEHFIEVEGHGRYQVISRVRVHYYAREIPQESPK